jgi:uncharacterized protein involved in type VI secretion and phage assembly
VPDDRRLDAVVVTLDGQPLAAERADLLRAVLVECSVQLPDTFTLRFDDPFFELYDAAVLRIGSQVEIAFRTEEAPRRVTTGEVTALAVQPGPNGRHELVASGMDVGHRLARGPKSRSFLQMTSADIACRIADEHGLDADVDATGEVHDYVLQRHETDRSLLVRLGRRIGFDTWVSERTLHFRQRPAAEQAAPELRWGEDLESFRVRYSSTERCDEVTVRGWDPIGKRGIVGRASRRDHGTTAPAAEEHADEARTAFGSVERCAGQFPVGDQAEADALAAGLLQRATSGEFVAKVTAAGDPRIAAGADIEIAGVGTRLSGRYLVTSVEHRYEVGAPYRSRFECGGKDPTSLAELTGGAGGEDARRWGRMVVGVVTNGDDPEQLGRVKVLFPSLTDEDESTWARTVAPGAGPDRGLQCLPEVGDEVLVAFEHDDPHRPVVLGGMWNREDLPPDREAAAGGQVTARTWRSRVGHELRLDDAGDEVVLRLGDDTAGLRLNAAESALHGERVLRVDAQELALTADRRIRIAAPSVEIDGSGDVTVTGGVIRLN